MQGFVSVVFFKKATKAFLLSSSSNCGWMVSFFQLSRTRKIRGHLDTAHWSSYLFIYRIYSNKRPTSNYCPASNKRPPPLPPPSQSNSNKHPPPPHPLEWQWDWNWNWISTKKKTSRGRSFLQSILQKPSFVTSSRFVISIYCFVAK